MPIFSRNHQEIERREACLAQEMTEISWILGVKGLLVMWQMEKLSDLGGKWVVMVGVPLTIQKAHFCHCHQQLKILQNKISRQKTPKIIRIREL